MIYKVKYLFIFLFITCLVTLTMQSSIVGFSKVKALKTQNSLNSPLAEEEEEHHKEKETGSDVLFFEHHVPFSTTRAITDLIWPVKELNYYSHTSDILIPPPKI